MIAAAFGDDTDSKKNGKKSYRHKYKKDDSWLDYAWFHDHGHNV